MIQCAPDYLGQFHCLASACPKSCCVGWEVTVDDATAAYYQTVPGAFGGKLRDSLTTEDGERCFARRGGRCPFLDAEHLCEIHRNLGPEHTSATCRAHPRFTEEYGSRREISLSASCPAAAELLLGSRAPLRFPAGERENAVREDEPLRTLLACRARILALLRDRTRPLTQRMSWILLFCNEAQFLQDEERQGEILSLCRAYRHLPPAVPPELAVGGSGLFPAALQLLEALEYLEEDWRPLLKAAEAAEGRLPDWAGERVMSYFIFRYFLKAAGDGDLLSRAQLAVFSTLTIGRLAAAGIPPVEAAYRYGREVEHCHESLECLQQAFCGREELSLSRFFAELEKREREIFIR